MEKKRRVVRCVTFDVADLGSSSSMDGRSKFFPESGAARAVGFGSTMSVPTETDIYFYKKLKE
jgi:hypothetical protein